VHSQVHLLDKHPLLLLLLLLNRLLLQLLKLAISLLINV
jgi:hypothetical protein